MTRDIDIVIEIQKADTNTLFQIFQNDFYIDKDSIEEAIKYQGMFNIIHNNSIFKVDFILRKDETYRAIEFRRRKRVQMRDMPIWIVAPEDLIISKLFWAKDSFSERQLNDITNLLGSIQNLDKEYIHKWVQNLELSQIFEKVEVYG